MLFQKLSFLVILLFTTKLVNAQNKTGIVHYEQIIEVVLPDSLTQNPQMASFYAMMPKEIHANMILYFNNEASLYENDKEAKPDENLDPNSMEAVLRQAMSKSQAKKFYTDLTLHKTYNQTEFMGRKFLVEGDIEKAKWKMTGKQKMILNTPCQEAVRNDSTINVTAWFAPSISVPFGPSPYGGLPGLILQVEYKTDKSKITLLPKNVDLKEFDKTLMVKPNEGKKMTKEEYDIMFKEKTKDMMQSGQNMMMQFHK